jgi:ATP/ADP translocase
LLTFATISASAPYVAGFLLSAMVVWIIATRVLGKQFTELTASPHKPITVDEGEEEEDVRNVVEIPLKSF